MADNHQSGEKYDIGLEEALSITIGNLKQLSPVTLPVEANRETFSSMHSWADVLLTSGGAWKSERDLTVTILEEMGGRVMFHRVRIGPGKAVAFAKVQEKPVFCLPGGPPSNLVAFLQLALPGLQKLGGCRMPGLAEVPAVLKKPVSGQRDWTQVLFGTLGHNGQTLAFEPDGRPFSRLKSMAEAEALLLIPEGVEAFSANQTVTIQVLVSIYYF